MNERDKTGKAGQNVAQGPFCPLPAHIPQGQTSKTEPSRVAPPPVQERSSLFGAPLRMPNAKGAAAGGVSTPPCEPPAPEPQINMLSYLIVDDVIPSCHVAQTILRALGVPAKKIFIANNLQDAHRVMRGNPIQVIISDLNLTDGSGLDLLHSIRTRGETRHLPFVLVTNSPELEYITEAKQLGVSSCLVKPLSVATLQLHIEYAIRSYNAAPSGGSVAPHA